MENVQSHNPWAPRLNVLLTEDRPHATEHWTQQLPRLLEPLGIAAVTARSGREAVDLASQMEIHAAVIDLGTPVGDAKLSRANDSGLWVLELFRRLERQPPIVLLNSPVVSDRQLNRLLSDSLRLGVFSVLSKPVTVEQVLGVFQRLVDSHYRGNWPGRADAGASDLPDGMRQDAEIREGKTKRFNFRIEIRRRRSRDEGTSTG